MGSRKLFWLVVLIAFGLYGTMIFWSIPKLVDLAGGLLPFDMRPAGYSFAEAEAYIAGLGSDGIGFYLQVQQRLDALFPFFEMLAIGWAILLLLPKNWPRGSRVLALFAVPGTVFDYLENFKVAQMLKAGLQGINPAMVETASLYTIAKSVSVTIALMLLLGLMLAAMLARVQKRRRS